VRIGVSSSGEKRSSCMVSAIDSIIDCLVASKLDQYLCPVPERIMALAASELGLFRALSNLISVGSKGAACWLILKKEASAFFIFPGTHCNCIAIDPKFLALFTVISSYAVGFFAAACNLV